MEYKDEYFIKTIKSLLNGEEGVDKGKTCVYIGGKSKERIMEENFDVTTYLKKHRDHLLNQLRKVNKAIAAMESDEPSTVQPDLGLGMGRKRRVQWSREITRIFNERIGETLAPADVKDALIAGGFAQVESPTQKNVIYTTLTRLTEKEIIEKVDTGLYRKKQQPRRSLGLLDGH